MTQKTCTFLDGECERCNLKNCVGASKKMTIIEVTQFFDYKNMSWKDLLRCDEKGVLPSEDKSVFLWAEKPKIRIVNEREEPSIGHVWLFNHNNKVEVLKANYDSSD
jgi:hypothetical protein